MDSKNEPGKGSSGQPGSGNRPHATLDLKAVEVKSADDRQTSGAGVGPEAEADDAADLEGEEPVAQTAGGRKGGYGGFFTHLVAGIAGGIFALLMADVLASQLGLGNRSSAVDFSPIEQRLAALEAASKSYASWADVGARLKAADAKIAKAQGLSSNIDVLNEKQAALAADVKALVGKTAAAPPASGDVAARVGKLEEQLSAMSAAAQSDPGAGRLPQLAALTGKIADLETMLPAKLDALRKSVADEIETRVSVANEAGEQAKAATTRLDRDVASVKGDQARMQSDLAALKSETERANVALKTTGESLTGLRAEIDARLSAFAKSADLTAAVAPVASRLSSLQDDVHGVIASEEARKTTAKRIVLSLDLTDLKRVIERGAPYSAELAKVREAAGPGVELAALDRFADKGVPTLPELRAEFKPLAYKLIDSEEQPSDGIVGRLLSGAKSVVRVRKVNHAAEDKTVEAVVSRMETALAEDRLADFTAEAATLPQPAQDIARDFLTKVAARNSVDTALRTVEAQLKASLVTPEAPVAAPAGSPAADTVKR
jgi:hypothetical protein